MILAPYSRAEEKLFYALAALGALVVAIGFGAALYMEHNGHVVTGMNNQVVWGVAARLRHLSDRRRLRRPQRRLDRLGVRQDHLQETGTTFGPADPGHARRWPVRV